MTILSFALLVCAVVSLSSCYYTNNSQTPDGLELTAHQIDSLNFYSSHHYTKDYNFVVKSDSLRLLVQVPEEELNQLTTDSLFVRKHDLLVVADIRNIPTDSVDSVWVQLARDEATIGWTRESRLLPKVVPADPISQFIDFFSNTHLLIFMVIMAVIGIAYLMRKLARMGSYIVHFNDISSFYPTLLALLVASSATLYASIQNFVPETWRHFYFHPTLNPFAVPPILGIFLASVWAILIVGLASFDDVRKSLKGGDAVLYLAGLAGVCAIDYIVFSICTLYYVGYLLLIAYIVFAVYRYWNFSRCKYICGNCGTKLHSKGKCPNCGMWNK